MTNRFIRVNGQDFSFDEIAKALGVGIQDGKTDHTIQLCQRVNAGVLTAEASPEGDNYPGIDVELQLPQELETAPILISRTEQPMLEEGPEALRTYCYSRYDEYFAYFDADTRPDKEVDNLTFPPSLAVSGGTFYDVEVTAEDPHVKFNAFHPRRYRRETPDVEAAQQLAADIDRFSSDYDTYEYLDQVGDDSDRNIREIFAMLAAGKVDPLKKYFMDIIAEDPEVDVAERAVDLLARVNVFSAYQMLPPERHDPLAAKISAAETRTATTATAKGPGPVVLS